MKYLAITMLPFLIVGFLSSCEEVLPERVIVASVDSTYMQDAVPEAQPRTLLFEEYTGASCSNCPDGHSIVKNLISLYGTKFAPIALHQGVLAKPVKETDEDLKTDESAQLAASYGVNSLPSAVVNRIKFDGNWSQSRSKWESLVTSVINNPVKVNLSSEVVIDPLTQKDILELKIEILEDIADGLNFSIMLGEDEIIAGQIDGLDKIEKYKHEHVLRKMYTNTTGEILKNPEEDGNIYKKGRVFIKKLELDGLESHWKRQDLYVICFVSNASSREVMQATVANF